jgi:hypothetical protein
VGIPAGGYQFSLIDIHDSIFELYRYSGSLWSNANFLNLYLVYASAIFVVVMVAAAEAVMLLLLLFRFRESVNVNSFFFHKFNDVSVLRSRTFHFLLFL